MTSNFFSNAETLNTRRQALTRDQQNRIRGGVVSPPINDNLAVNIDTSGMDRALDQLVYEDIRSRVQTSSSRAFNEYFSNYPGLLASEVVSAGRFSRPITSGPTRSIGEMMRGDDRYLYEDIRDTRTMVELPLPEENYDTVRDTTTHTNIRAESDTLNIPRRWLYDAATTDPRGIGINLEEAIRTTAAAGPRIRGFDEDLAGHTGNINIGAVTGRNPHLGARSMNMRLDTFPVGSSSFKNQLLEILKNDYELKMSSQKYGDRLEFKISLVHTESKEEILSAEDFIEMDE